MSSSAPPPIPNFHTIVGQNESATVRASFDAIRSQLTQDQQWAAGVLEMAGRSGARVAYAKAYGSLLGSTVVSESPGNLLIRGTSGKDTRLMYRIQSIDQQSTRISPEGKVEGPAKIVIPIALLCFCIVPVALTPLAYKARASAMRRFSAKYLDAFCRYLEAHQHHKYLDT